MNEIQNNINNKNKIKKLKRGTRKSPPTQTTEWNHDDDDDDDEVEHLHRGLKAFIDERWRSLAVFSPPLKAFYSGVCTGTVFYSTLSVACVWLV